MRYFIGYFCFAVFLMGLFLLIYLWVTPYAELELIRSGNLAARRSIWAARCSASACRWPARLPTASASSTSDCGRSSRSIVQIGVHFLSRVLIKDMTRLIESGTVSVGAMACCLSLGFGILNAACLTY